MRRQRPLLLALLAAACLLAGCRPATDPAAAPVPAPPPAPPAATAVAPAVTTVPTAPMRIRYASQFASSDVPVYIAADRGYFQEAGIDLELVRFGNSSEIIPALGTGQVDAASLGTNPALWNAIARGISLKMVLDKGTFRPGWGDQALVIRKAVYDAGRGHTLDDLRGLNVAMTPPGRGTASGCALGAGLQRAGLTLDALEISAINFPEMLAALANGAIDGAMLNEPFLARAQRQGTIVRTVELDEMYPNFTISSVIFSPALYNDRPVAKGFVRAFIRAVRDYLAARAGTPQGLTWTDVVETMARYTGLDAASLLDLGPTGFNPNGLPNQDALLHCYQFFRAEGLIPAAVPEQTLATIFGTNLVDEVLAEMGRLPEN
jgi:NitT/TauT family transport system substrate-binding protein